MKKLQRFCTQCPKLRWDESELIAHSDHLATHNPSPAQWSEAHNMIQAAKDKRKGDNA